MRETQDVVASANELRILTQRRALILVEGAVVEGVQQVLREQIS